MKVCRICLSKDGRLYEITSNGFYSLYYQLTGLLKLEMDVDKRLPQWVCAECGLRLLSYDKLRQKSLRAHQILNNLLERVNHITEEDLDQIDRKKNDLYSNLSYAIKDNMTVQEYKVDMQMTERTERKPKVKTKEFDIEVFKIEKDFSNDSNSDNEVLTSKNKTTKRVKKEVIENKKEDFGFNVQILSLKEQIGESDFMSDFDDLSSDSLYSVKKRKTFTSKPSKTQSKTKSKKAQLDIKKSVDKYMNSLNKKITKKVNKKEVKKRVRKKEVKKEVQKPSDPFEDVFNIHILSMEEQMAEFEKRKESPKYINAPFQCDQCYKGFTAEVTFIRHQLMHTDKWGKFECKICKRRFRTISTYCDHMRSHKTVYSCKECNFKAGVRDMASLHRSKHKGTVYNCPHCDLKFVNKNTQMLHIRVKHVSQFVCELCGHSFLNAKGVEQHKNLKHPLEIDTTIVSTDGPTCATCNIKFVTDEALNTHQRVAHPLPPTKIDDARIIQCQETNKVCKVFPCRVCGKEFTTRGNRTRHMVIHTGLRPFLCETCGSSFKTRGDVKAHNEHVHLKVPWPRKQARGSRHGNKNSF